jgi:hypothetical protein
MLPMTLFCASRTGSEDTPSLFMSSRAVARGLSPLDGRSARFFAHQLHTYLMAKTLLEPISRSLISCGYSWSTTGKLCRFSQKNETRRNCVSTPTTSVVPSFTTKILCTPLPKTSIALVKSTVSDSVMSGSFLPRSLTSLSGIALPSLPFFASSSKEATSSSSGWASPTTRSRYAFRSL